MSTYVASTQAFIDLFETGKISLPSLEEVYEQTRHLQDNEDISNGIEAWLKSQNNSELLQAYQNKLQQFRSGNSLELSVSKGPGKSKSQTKPGEPNPSSRELLENIIIKNKPLNNDSQAKPTHP
ncbi:MAG: hypothetical protein F6K41_44610 [Symploca sp. SIO3E6]|nr:hypothetical protein [Caldora sp. SIO3E6]